MGVGGGVNVDDQMSAVLLISTQYMSGARNG